MKNVIWILALLALTSCKPIENPGKSDEQHGKNKDKETEITPDEIDEQLVEATVEPVKVCLAELAHCDRRMIHITEKYFMQPVDLYAVVCGTAGDYSIGQDIVDLIEQKYTTTLDESFDPDTEEDYGRAFHVSQPFSTDFLVAIDSANGSRYWDLLDETPNPQSHPRPSRA